MANDECLAVRLKAAIDSELAEFANILPNIAVEENKDSLSVRAKSYLAVKIKPTKTAGIRIEFDPEYDSFVDAKYYMLPTSDGKSRIAVSDEAAVLGMAPQLARIALDVLSRHGCEAFACCSRYIECSDSRACVAENPLFPISCQYNRNLKNGIIFYGKNRNVG